MPPKRAAASRSSSQDSLSSQSSDDVYVLQPSGIKVRRSQILPFAHDRDSSTMSPIRYIFLITPFFFPLSYHFITTVQTMTAWLHLQEVQLHLALRSLLLPLPLFQLLQDQQLSLLWRMPFLTLLHPLIQSTVQCTPNVSNAPCSTTTAPFELSNVLNRHLLLTPVQEFSDFTLLHLVEQLQRAFALIYVQLEHI